MMLALVLLLSTNALVQEQPLPVYACQGFKEPLHRADIRVERGRNLPLRGRLVLANGTPADGNDLATAPIISVKFKDADQTSEARAGDFGKGKSFQFFELESHWKFDLETSSLTGDGEYAVTMLSGDPGEYTIDPPCKLVFTLEP